MLGLRLNGLSLAMQVNVIRGEGGSAFKVLDLGNIVAPLLPLVKKLGRASEPS